ncbi:MAG: DUF58 domain-containing protein [Propionicimonas sp.]
MPTRAELTLRGRVMLTGGALWTGAAWLVGQRDLTWPGLFLVCLPLASWLILAIGSGGPHLQRFIDPVELSVGETLTDHLQVEHGGAFLGAGVIYSELFPAALSAAEQGPVAAGTGGFGAQQHTLVYRATARWRGRHRIGPLQRTALDALGLAQTRTTLPDVADVLALPTPEPLSPVRDASGVGSTTDSSLLRTSLMGQDDVLIREYAAGDDVRRIHWRSTARLGELMVRREERAWDPSAVVILDNRAGGFRATRPDDRFEWLVRAAASISAHLSSRGFSVALSDSDASADQLRAAGRIGMSGILRELAEVEPSDSGTLQRALLAAPGGVQGQLLIALLGGLSGPDAAALAAARPKHRSCWALVLEPARVDAQAVTLLGAAGWRCVRVPPGTPVDDAWRSLGEVGGS